MIAINIKEILAQMTLEEKAALCQGRGSWHTRSLKRLGVPAMMMSDGPHGLRKQDLSREGAGADDAIQAVCFPTAAGMACSFDRALLEEMGAALGQSCQGEDVGVILGPAANIKRSPLCGRNFEYFSEDPYLSGEMAAAHIRGVQSQGVGASLKHFAANNQESRRMSVSVNASQRTLREIYLAGFERAVKEARPWTVMCSYNKIGGVYSSENDWLLNRVLRGEWGFDGLTMTDWGAANDRAKGIAAGLDLEMPESGAGNDRAICQAVEEGRLSQDDLDRACEHILEMVDRYLKGRKPGQTFDREAQHLLARRMAREAMVLLKNEDHVLPIGEGKKVAFIGEFAQNPRFQGGGSSHINCCHTLCALEEARALRPVCYAQGYHLEGDQADPALEEEAVRIAQQADVAVVFAGLPDAFESEGFDRAHMNIPRCQLQLIDRVTAAQPRTVVVLHNGAPVEMPFAGRVSAILEAYLAGQAGGGAVVDLLFGLASPCGKLAETFPLRLEDTPAYLNFPGQGDQVDYAEGVFVGYRYYDKRKMPVLFPFGHGLTYTTFAYEDMRLSASVLDAAPIRVDVKITNTGNAAAREIVQFYVAPECPGPGQPVRQLKGFDKVSLAPGESAVASCLLDRRAFAYWDEGAGQWHARPGRYRVEAAASSRDIRLTGAVQVAGEHLPLRVTLDTPFGDVLAIPACKEALGEIMEQVDSICHRFDGDQLGAGSREMAEAMMRDLPIHALPSFVGEAVSREQLCALVQRLNQVQKG